MSFADKGKQLNENNLIKIHFVLEWHKQKANCEFQVWSCKEKIFNILYLLHEFILINQRFTSLFFTSDAWTIIFKAYISLQSWSSGGTWRCSNSRVSTYRSSAYKSKSKCGTRNLPVCCSAKDCPCKNNKQVTQVC